MSALDEFEIADDNRQKIVEVVRDSSRQLADSLEASGLCKFLTRARELDIAFPRDRESLIKAARNRLASTSTTIGPTSAANRP